MKRSDPYRGTSDKKNTDRCPHTDRSPREMDWLLGQRKTSRKMKVLGITSRGPESDFSWLKCFVTQKYSDLFEVKYLPISDYNREEWEEDVRLCSAVILYHTEHQGEINITDVDGALYDSELYYMNNILGREKVLVMLDNISKEERCRIPKTLQSLSAHLIFIPEKNKSEATKKELTEFFEAVSKGVKTSQQESTGVTPITHQSQSPPPSYKIGIFSRSAESNYSWLIDSLKADDHMGSLDIKAVCITNNYKMFSSALKNMLFRHSVSHKKARKTQHHQW
ncbi:unnamed protein product [Staurois parvus]|uniref:Uncharacterized protein n=1 Tax=Staurois parvus TaxID=386267 RepID=A0ABN9FKS4_9NEOB|nr:unnamed protein product [Staurois parvus]